MTSAYTTVLADLNKSEMAIYRWNLVQYAETHGISAAARFYNMSRKTVRKWLNVWKQDGREALVDGRHGPHNQPQKTPVELEQQIIAFRQRHPHLGAARIRIELKLELSTKAIHGSGRPELQDSEESVDAARLARPLAAAGRLSLFDSGDSLRV